MRINTLLLGIVIALVMTTTSVAAQVVVSTGDVPASPGETIQIPVSIEIPEGMTEAHELGSLTVWFHYDPALLTYNNSNNGLGTILSGTASITLNAAEGDAKLGVTGSYDPLTGVFRPLNTGLDGSIILFGFDVNNSIDVSTGASCELGIYTLIVSNETTQVSAIPNNGTFTVTGVVATTGDININEIMYDPPETDTNHEWIELYNNDTKAINITGWKFYEAGTNHGLTLEQGSMTIPIEGYAIIADNATMFLYEHPVCTCTVIDSTFSLSNTEEYIALKNATLDIIDDVTYNASWGAKDNNRTLELNAIGGWEESLIEGGTPCQPNSVLAPPEDEEPPVVTDPDANPSSIPADGTTTSQLNVTVTDNVAVPSVTVNLSELGGSATQEMTNIAGTDIYTVTTTAAVGTAPATYLLNVNATDTSGNYNNTVDISLEVTAPTELPVLEAIVVLPVSVILNIGNTQQFTAQGYDQFGNEMTGIAFDWSSGDETVGTVNETGFFEALTVGSTVVNATNGTIVGSASVTVSPINITVFEVSDGTLGSDLEANVTIRNEGTSEEWFIVKVTGVHETTGYPLVGTGVVRLDVAEEIAIPLLVYIPASADEGSYNLYADVWIYDEYPDLDKAVYAGPEVATVTSSP